MERKKTVGIFEGCLFKGRMKAVPVMEFRKRGVLGGAVLMAKGVHE